MALIPQVVDAVTTAVVAAGGIADSRGIAAALMLGVSAVQIGTSYLWCREATTSVAHRAVLAAVNRTTVNVLTIVLTGRPGPSSIVWFT